MRWCIPVLLALAACTSYAQAREARGVMAVSVTVVNTCFFGQQARCHLPGTLLRTHVERAARPAAAASETVGDRRVTHL